MKMKNTLHVAGGNLAEAETHISDRVPARAGKSSKRPDAYPEGCIGANLPKGHYVKYLIERYHRFREADERSGPNGCLQYSEIFQNIESKFKSRTYYIPEGRFAELVDFLHYRIDNTMLGRVNSERGISSYKSFDEYVMQHMEMPVNA